MFEIEENKSDSYAPRTWFNARNADMTIALAIDLNTHGEKLTAKAAGEKYIGFLLSDDSYTDKIAEEIIKKMKKFNVKTINIAGNGIYTLNKYGCDQEHINLFVFDIFSRVSEQIKIKKIYTGGQTGVDLAGAIAGFLLKIPTLVTMPKGFKQRFENGKDIIQKKEDIYEQIINWANIIENKTNMQKVKP